ncbi:c-type cytochrome biogenesis protein CcsB [Conyzicola sp.]|uniref:c-type cytochrome biogenesis protein CcsB n=1 Tax=Conyzicola sp. TaxID=1969404 RepID=UPI003989DAA4
MTLTLETMSLIAVYSAMVVYTFAFIAFTVDLARRSAPAPVAVEASVGQLAASSARTSLLEKLATDAPDDGAAKVSRAMRLALGFTILGWVLHVVAVVLRGLAAGYAPWSNMYGFAITATAIIVGVFLFVQFWQDLKFLGAYIVGFCLAFLGLATVNFYVAVAPQPPALQSAWLVIHVFVAILGTAFFALGGGLSVVQLLQVRREARGGEGMKFLATLPNAEKLENLAYRLILVGFVFWTFTLIAGAVWAERAWGRYWGWDTKEVWTFIIWTLFAGYIHARATRGWRGSRSAWLAIIGFAAVMFNFTVVNLFFKGLHAYSGL